MLRDLNVSVNGRRDSTDSRVGVRGSEIPSGFARPAFLLNDVDAAFPNRLYSLEILTLPSEGVLALDKAGAGTFSGAAVGTYTGTQRVEKFDPGVGRISSREGTYTLQIAEAQPTVISVTVTPATATGSQQFAATVVGTNNPSQIVNWSATVGQIDASGNFTAPAATNTVQTITITATSVLDPSKSGSATVTIAALPASTVTDVDVSPDDANILGGDLREFFAVVGGENNPSQLVLWTTTFGVINEVGELTTPELAPTQTSVGRVIATSVQDPTKSGSALFTVRGVAVIVDPPPIDEEPLPEPDTSDAPRIFLSTIMHGDGINLTSVLL